MTRGKGQGARGDGGIGIRVAVLCLIALTAVLGISARRTPVAPGPSPLAPSRIISLIPAVTEMLFAMGAGDQVVGVSNFDHYPAAVEQRTRVGGLIDPNFERILSLKPDLVIVYGTQGDLIRRLERVSIPMFHYQHAGLPDITRTMRLLGQEVGRADEAARLVDQIQTGLADVRRRVAGTARPRTMIVFDREAGSMRGAYGSGGIGFLHDMLEVAGGENVFADVKRQSVQATSELVLTRKPEVILELHSGAPWDDAHLAREQAVWGALKSVPAVRNKQVYILVDEKLSIPGPRVVEAVRVFAKILHPDKF